MKTVVSKELMTRLKNAAANGSVVASDILSELKKGKENAETIRGNAGYFSTKRIKSTSEGITRVKIVITACTKDVNNEHFPDRGNPQAPWFRENRTDMEPSTFVECFKNLSPYDSEALGFFSSALSMDGKISIKLHAGMNDFVEAYDQNNYTPYVQSGEVSLHNSCMRHEKLLGNIADFYHNFAGAKIIVARDQAGYMLGRAIVWENVVHKDENGTETIVSVLDRIYYSHTFIIDRIRDYAQRLGIQLRRRCNSSSNPRSFSALNDVESLGLEKGGDENFSLCIRVPASRWHKKGAPYMDTFGYLTVREDLSLELSNRDTGREIAVFHSTGGYADPKMKFCPYCGGVHNDLNGSDICNSCHEKIYVNTPFGEAVNCKTVTCKGEKYPSVFFSKKRKPIPSLDLYLKIRKLFLV